MTVALSSPLYVLGAWSAGDTGVTDTNGTTWGVRPGTTGIFDGPDVRLNQSPFANADGAQRSRNFRIPRQMTLSGWARGSTIAGTEASRRAFVNLLAGGGQDTLSITYLDGLTLTALVERGAQPKATPASAGEFDWQLTLSAVDPSLYGPAVGQSTGLPSGSGGLDWSTGGGLDWTGSGTGGLNWGVVTSLGLITLTNNGQIKTWPTFTIVGPVTNPTIVGPNGRVLLFTDTLSASDTVVLRSNPINRAVTKNNVPFRPNLTVAQWWSLAAQSSVTVQFQGISAGTPTLTVSTSDAY